jgi:hypothetical protein
MPSLVGFTPDEAEAAAAELGLTIAWIDDDAPHWLPPHHAPRVGRQRLREDGMLELLRVQVPSLPDDEGTT